MPNILLSTLNARYIHSSLGLRYLLANMGELRQETAIREFTLEPRTADVAERLLRERPRIIGFGVYIWNLTEITRLVALIKTLAPEVILVLGGPEVSHEWEAQEVVRNADYLITGQADLRFAQLCRQLLAGYRPGERVVQAVPPRLEQVAFPYDYYDDEDIANRIVYVESSRGCPFKCEFCLSALDKTAYPFDLAEFLAQMARLYARGVRHFKFVDRTFNLDVRSSTMILEFFLQHWDERLFLHFEVVPDRLPAQLTTLLARFPEGTLQLEIGIQSFDPVVQARIGRKQNAARTQANLTWLRRHTGVHLHTDLIAGLPGEEMAGFGRGFDQLVALHPHEIQVGILKRLKGTPIIRHSHEFRMRYNPNPPFDIVATDRIDFGDMQRLNRFARYWDMIGNSGRFSLTLPLILGDQPFEHFMALSDWLFQTTGQVHRIALKRLFELLFTGMTDALYLSVADTRKVLLNDFRRAGLKGRPSFDPDICRPRTAQYRRGKAGKRQFRHIDD